MIPGEGSHPEGAKVAQIGDPARTSDPGQANSVVIYGADGLGGAN